MSVESPVQEGLGPNVVNQRVYELQAMLNLSEMVTDPGMIDGRYGLRTNASVGSYINRPGNGLKADEKKSYKPNTARGELPTNIDTNFILLVQQDLFRRLNEDTSFRAAVVQNAIGRLERNDPSKKPDQPDDIRSVRILGNLLHFTNTSDKPYTITGNSAAENAHLLKQLRELATKENMPVVGAPSASTVSADEIERLRKERDQAVADKAAADIRARDAEARANELRIENAQSQQSAKDALEWEKTLAHKDFPGPSQALADRYCRLFVQSFCMPVINDNDSPEKKAAALRQTQRVADDMKHGRLLITEDGHVIYMRMNPEGTKVGDKERHTILAYDITEHINKNVDVPGGQQALLKGLENIRFINASKALRFYGSHKNRPNKKAKHSLPKRALCSI
jgi:hypothetical protein